MTIPTLISPALIQLGMNAALAQARLAAARDEVPVGASILDLFTLKIVAEAGNRVEELHDATAHAEAFAIRAASSVRAEWRLDNCALFVTLEPCTMCVGAIRNARLGVVVFGAHDARAGAAGSLYDLLLDDRLGQVPRVISGVCADECAELLRKFFKDRRLLR